MKKLQTEKNIHAHNSNIGLVSEYKKNSSKLIFKNEPRKKLRS